MQKNQNAAVAKSNLLVTHTGQLILLGDILFKVQGIEEFLDELYFKIGA